MRLLLPPSLTNKNPNEYPNGHAMTSGGCGLKISRDKHNPGSTIWSMFLIGKIMSPAPTYR